MTRRFSTRFFLLFTVVILLTGCQGRERINPFDPRGADEDPFQLRVSSNPESIILNWDFIDSPDLTEYRVYRSSPEDSMALYAEVAPGTTQYTDREITPEQTYVYGVTAVGEQNETRLSRLDTITPGYSRWWALADDYSPLVQLSHDGLHSHRTYGNFGSLEHVVAPRNANYIFLYDLFDGSVLRQYASGDVNRAVQGVPRLQEMHYISATNEIVTVPLSQAETLQLHDLVNGSRREITMPSSIRGLDTGRSGVLFVLTGTAVYTISPGSASKELFFESNLSRSFSAIASINNQEIFIADTTNDEVLRIRGQQVEYSVAEISEPRDLELNHNDESLWIRSRNSQEETYEIYRHLNAETGRMLAGVPNMLDFAVNPVNNVCIAAGYNRRTLYQISPDGTVRTAVNMAGRIYKIVVQPLINS